VEYLTRMEALRVSISMESYAQRDPLVQYKSQASTMFTELLSEVRQTVISKMYRYRPSLPPEYTTGLRSAASAQPEPAFVGAGGARASDPPDKSKKKRKRH
jgi:preprotein translocase subunit SecA